jgi:hypothetical protein
MIHTNSRWKLPRKIAVLLETWVILDYFILSVY